MSFTQRLFTSYQPYADGNYRIGELYRIWYDSITHTLRIQLDNTPGGTIIAGGGAVSGPAQGITFVGDDSSGTRVSDGETLKITGTGGITTAVSGDTLTITGPNLSSYLTAEADTLDSVTDRGAITTNNITIGNLTFGSAGTGINFYDTSTLTYFPTQTNKDGKYLKVTRDISGNDIMSWETVATITGAVVYKGLWNAATNQPPVSDASGSAGWQYTVVGSATVDLGNGSISVQDGDLLIHNGAHYDLIPGPRSQIQSDWAQTNSASLDYIRNKPTTTITVVGDDSSGTIFNVGETIKIAGTQNITTAVSGDTLTITGPNLTPYLTNSTITVVGDDSTGTILNTGETIKIAGTSGISTAVSGDTLTITGPDLSGYATQRDYISAYDTQTQLLTSSEVNAGTAKPVLVRSTASAQDISIVSNSRITVTKTSVYNLQFSLQLENTGGGGSGSTVEIWLRQDGNAVPNSNTQVSVNTNSPYVVAAWNFVIPLTAGHYVELMWYTDNHHIEMPAIAAGDRPRVPSAIITLTEV